MSQPETQPDQAENSDAEARELPAAAKRALAEAEERRRKRDIEEQAAPKEVGGTAGPDPARYGDWEKDGIVSDF